MFGKLRTRLFPKGTLRDRALSVWTREGIVPFFRRGGNLLFKKIRQVLLSPFWKPRANEKAPSWPDFPSALPGKADIMCFAVIAWDFRFQRPQQLLTQFAFDGHRVFYVSPTFGGFGQPSPQVRQISERIYEITLPGEDTLAMYRDELMGNALFYSAEAMKALIEIVMPQHVVSLVHHPFWLPLVRLLKNEYKWDLVYDCMDNVSGFEVAGTRVAVLEHELVSESDLIVTTSKSLYHRWHAENPDCILIPNAADYAHFSRLPERSGSPIAQMPRPVIGYYGAISEWFDTMVIQQAATRHPEWSFVLIGDTWGADVKSLRRISNVHFLGEKPYKDLPAFLGGFDVAIIPFLRIPLTEDTNPVKVFEYLSAGVPVVATALPELQSLGDLILLYSTPDEFVAGIETALKTDNPELRAKRQAFARENTWDKRYQLLKTSLELIDRK